MLLSVFFIFFLFYVAPKASITDDRLFHFDAICKMLLKFNKINMASETFVYDNKNLYVLVNTKYFYTIPIIPINAIALHYATVASILYANEAHIRIPTHKTCLFDSSFCAVPGNPCVCSLLTSY